MGYTSGVGGPKVRAIALALVESTERPAILVSEGYDSVLGAPFHRLLGGGIEPGERAADTVRRELAEEIGVAVRVGERLATIESIFTYEGRPGHEVVLVYEAELVDPALYACERFEGIESDPVHAVWHPLDGPGSELPVYPPGALSLVGRARRRGGGPVVGGSG